MIIQEVFKKETSLVKRKKWKRWYKAKIYRNGFSGAMYLESEDGAYWVLNSEDIFADDWEIKKWYEVNFKEKYPNGVLCWVWDYNDKNGNPINREMKIVIDVINNGEYFLTKDCIEYRYAEPVNKDEIPTIL